MARIFAPLLLAIVGVSVLCAQTGEGSPAVLGRLVDIGGRRVHIYCTGQGSPTVVVAGGFSFGSGPHTTIHRPDNTHLHLRPGWDGLERSRSRKHKLLAARAE